MINTILALISMSMPHVETWMTHDLRITKAQIQAEVGKAIVIGLERDIVRTRERGQRALDRADAVLRQFITKEEARDRKAAEAKKPDAERNQVD